MQPNLPVGPRAIAACTFFICAALAGYAAQFGDFEYEEYDTYIEITDYPDDATGDVVIPSEIVGKPVTSIGREAFGFCTSLTGVTIPDSVISIGRGAFVACSNLTSVTIPDNVTRIGSYAFTNCQSLTAFIVNTANPAFRSVDGIMFDRYQTMLIQYPIGKAGTTYTIPDSVTSIGLWAFGFCTSLTNVTIPNNVTSIGLGAFSACNSLTSVTIPESVSTIPDQAFRYCTSLTSVTIGNGVSSIGNEAFSQCWNLTSVMIPDSVTIIGEHVFFGCSSLTSVTIGSGVSSIGNSAFRRCTNLISVTIPESVSSIPDHAFEYCYSLTDVTIPSSVTNIGNEAFAYCYNLTILYFEGNAPTLADAVSPFEYNSNLDIFHLAGTTGWGETFGDRPTRLTSGALDPLIGGLDLAGIESWFVSGWLGSYSTAFAPWLFHIDHGFIYRYPESSNASTYFYDVGMAAWWWTSSDIYTWIYAFDPPADDGGIDIDSAWLLYDRDSNSPRSFRVKTGAGAGSFLFFGP